MTRDPLLHGPRRVAEGGARPTEWHRYDAVGFWAVALCWGISAGALFAFANADLPLESVLTFLATYAFGFLLNRTWTEGRV